MKYLSKKFSGVLLELVKQKGVYPYEHMNSLKRFFEDRMPNKREVYSSLRGECVSDKDYLHAVNVWIMLEIKTMGDYHLYLKTDVLLLP